jgi:hypothetical protein
LHRPFAAVNEELQHMQRPAFAYTTVKMMSQHEHAVPPTPLIGIPLAMLCTTPRFSSATMHSFVLAALIQISDD